jgi:hypothetical protein
MGLSEALFDQLERVQNPALKGEELRDEIARTEAVIGVADRIVSGATLQFNAVKLVADRGPGVVAGATRMLLGAGDENGNGHANGNGKKP